MSTANLKKLVFRKELALIKDLITTIDPNVIVRTAEGEILYGEITHQPLLPTGYPIYLGEQILGWVHGRQTTISIDKTEAIAALLSHLATREMEKRTLAQELLSKYKEISLLFNLSEKIVDSYDIQEVSLLTLDESCRLLNSSNGAVFLGEDGSAHLQCIATFGTGIALQEAIELGEGILGNIITVGRGEIINDILSDPRHIIGQGRIVSLICVPLKHKEKILGAIVLTRTHQQPYTAEDLKILTTLACQATGIIGALLHERKLKESRQNDLIFRLSSQIRDSLELSIILDTAVQEIQLALGLDRCFFAWCDTEEIPVTLPWKESIGSLMQARTIEHLHIVTEAKSLKLPSLIGDYQSQDMGSLSQQLLRREWVQIDDVRRTQDPALRHFLKDNGFTALLAIPIQTHTGRIGVIGCSMAQETKAWSKDELALLASVTNQLAIALDQAELYNQRRITAHVAQEKAQQLEAALHELQQTQLRLIQSEKLSGLGQMVAGIAHEINNPVNFIHGNLPYMDEYIGDLMELLQCYQTEYPNPTPAVQEKLDDIDLDFLVRDLAKIQKSMGIGTDRIRDIVCSLKTFSRVDEASLKYIDLHEGMNSTLLMLEHRFKAIAPFPGIRLKKYYGNIPPIECYAGRLNQVFMNLIANAIDALEESHRKGLLRHRLELTLEIHTQLLDNQTIQIRIIDNGPGVPDAIRSKLFDPFFTTKESGKGTGLGLSISHQIITEYHNGTLECLSIPGEETVFIITLPITQPLPTDSVGTLNPRTEILA
jgi:two-component system, NtrC family, sensor kinase